MTPNRRRVLRGLGATAAGIGSLPVVGGARAQMVATTFELGGKTSGWIGRSPASIADTLNPTLDLEPTKTYEIVWENVDGQPHNVVIEDDAANRLVDTEIITSQGETQTVEFTADPSMTVYFCEVHPASMRGDVSTGAATETETETETPTPTPDEPTTTSGSDGTTHTVEMVTRGSQFYFDPIGLFVEPGDTVRWEIASGSHSTTAYVSGTGGAETTRIPDGADGWNSGTLTEGGATFDHAFETPGTYDYFCIPHKSLEMVGRVVVDEPGGPAEGSMPPDGDVPESGRIVDEGAVSFADFAGGNGSTPTASPTPTPTASPTPTPTETGQPGFTAVTAAGALTAAGVARLLGRRREGGE